MSSKRDKKFKVCIALGTRPEVIKLAPVIAAFSADPRLKVCVLATGQHRSMMDEALKVFGIVADHDLSVMQSKQTLLSLTARILQRVQKVLEIEKPDLMLVQGDTATTFACSLAAYYLRIPLAHVEAGLRTADKYRPFPEEGNRRLTGVLSDLHFPPTVKAKADLLREGIARTSILMTGNTVVDALEMVAARKRSFCSPVLRRLINDKKRIVLATLHRRESFGDGLRNVLLALKDISLMKDVEVVYPVHLNPNVRAQVDEVLSGGRVHLLEPLAYDEFVALLKCSYFVVTDSGGIQEEACALKKPILIAREKTERPEAVAAGFAELVGFNRSLIASRALRLLQDPAFYRQRSQNKNPFGDGKASLRIVKACAAYLQRNKGG